jgi:hypothetical protein
MTRRTTSPRSVDALASASSVSAGSFPRSTPWRFWRRSRPLRALGAGMITQGVTSQSEIDDLLGELESAKDTEYEGSFANLYIEMIAEVPDDHAAAQQHG